MLQSSSKKFKTEKFAILEVDVKKPTRTSYPIFDYIELKEKHRIVDPECEDDRFRDTDAERIVKALEEKYGKQYGSAKKKKLRLRPDDFIDKTSGYDATDDFIDDSEAYDEIVPSTMDTVHYGHYVNEGPLEFKDVFPDFGRISEPTTSESKSSVEKPKAKNVRDERMVGISPLIRKTKKEKLVSKTETPLVPKKKKKEKQSQALIQDTPEASKKVKKHKKSNEGSTQDMPVESRKEETPESKKEVAQNKDSSKKRGPYLTKKRKEMSAILMAASQEIGGKTNTLVASTKESQALPMKPKKKRAQETPDSLKKVKKPKEEPVHDTPVASTSSQPVQKIKHSPNVASAVSSQASLTKAVLNNNLNKSPSISIATTLSTNNSPVQKTAHKLSTENLYSITPKSTTPSSQHPISTNLASLTSSFSTPSSTQQLGTQQLSISNSSQLVGRKNVSLAAQFPNSSTTLAHNLKTTTSSLPIPIFSPELHNQKFNTSHTLSPKTNLPNQLRCTSSASQLITSEIATSSSQKLNAGIPSANILATTTPVGLSSQKFESQKLSTSQAQIVDSKANSFNQSPNSSNLLTNNLSSTINSTQTSPIKLANNLVSTANMDPSLYHYISKQAGSTPSSLNFLAHLQSLQRNQALKAANQPFLTQPENQNFNQLNLNQQK